MDDVILDNYQLNLFSNFSLIKAIILSFVFSYILSKVYILKASSLSNHENLAKIFPLLSVTVTLVIAVVKSSLALSLGLVGALSIVRFRTPIKEPEELTYIFLCIAIGLANGADQYLASFIGLSLSIICIYINDLRISKRSLQSNLILTIKEISPLDIAKIIEISSRHCKRIDLNNVMTFADDSDKPNTVSLGILPKNPKSPEIIVNELRDLFPKSEINIFQIKNF